MIKKTFEILILGILLGLAIACGNSGSRQAVEVDLPAMYDYVESDEITFENLTNRNKAFYVDRGYDQFVLVKRNGIDYLSTIITSDQVATGSPIGKLTPLTTILSHTLKDSNEPLTDYVNVNTFYELSYLEDNQIAFTDLFESELRERYEQLKLLIELVSLGSYTDKQTLMNNIQTTLSGSEISQSSENIFTPIDLTEYTGNDILFSDNMLTLADNLHIPYLDVGMFTVNGNAIETASISYTTNVTENYYTLDNTITNYYTLDNTITNNITQLTNTFLLSDFDTISGNSLVVGNIILDGNLLVPTVTNNYYTLDNTITNNYTLDNTITNNITQLTNTFLLTDFDFISGNSLAVGNIILDGNLLVPTVTNNYYTLDNTITNNITQLTNTYTITDFDSISGNQLIVGDNIILSGNVLEPQLIYNTTNITQLTNTFILTDFDAVSGNQIIIADNIILDGNVLEPQTIYNTTNVTNLTNTFVITDFDIISGNSITLSDNLVAGNINAGNLLINGVSLMTSTEVSTAIANATANILSTTSTNQTIKGNVIITGNLTSSNIIMTGDLLPDVDNARTLGNNVLAWKDIFVYDLTIMSDKNLKENIKDTEYGLEDILKLRPVEYNFKGKKENKLGLIAQEVEKDIPEIFVDGDKKAVNYVELIPVLIKAIQEQQKEIEELKRKLNE